MSRDRNAFIIVSFISQYGDFNWEIENGELTVESRFRKIGFLKKYRQPIHAAHAEQAQYQAEGRINLDREELDRLVGENASRSLHHEAS